MILSVKLNTGYFFIKDYKSRYFVYQRFSAQLCGRSPPGDCFGYATQTYHQINWKTSILTSNLYTDKCRMKVWNFLYIVKITPYALLNICT